jgi:hypothetical protein
MIKEDYCSYEVAKLLKEKGFDEEVLAVYIYDKLLVKGENEIVNPANVPIIPAPTHQMAMKWLREVHNKHCDIGYDIDLKWYFQIVDLKETFEYDYPETKYYHAENETNFETYEDAVEAALKYYLENFI